MNNKFMKKAIALLLSIALMVTTLCIVPIVASAVDPGPSLETATFKFWADPENTLTQDDVDAYVGGDKTALTGAVGCYKRSNSSSSYYLLLPSNADCNNLRVWFSSTSTVTVDGTNVTNGETTDVFKDVDAGGIKKTYSIKMGSSTYSVTAMKSGKVGTMYIETTSGSMKTVNDSSNHTASESGTVMVVDSDGNVEYDGLMDKIQGRGNGTWSAGAVKNPYNVKLAVSSSLLGMAKAKKWCLLANNGDNTLVKNQLTYDFADYIGVKFQPHCKPIDVYINQQYYGSYMLAEKVEIKSNRIDVVDAYENLEIANGTVDEETGVIIPADLSDAPATSVSATSSQNVGQKEYSTNQAGSGSSSGGSTGGLGGLIPGWGGGSGSGSTTTGPALVNPSDITGGYLYELEISQRWVDEKAGFCAYNRQGWVMKSCDVATKEMVDYSYDILYAMGAAVYNNGTVPSTSTTTKCSSGKTTVRTTDNPAPAQQYQGKKWYEILDADSAVKYYWTQEYFKNMDSSTSSTYFYKDSDLNDPMVYAGPVWDMDNSIGYSSNGSRWGHSWTSYDDWYTKNTRIYRFYYSDSTTSYSTDAYAPLSFYGALASNNEDFWQMAGAYWYNIIEPAIDVLTGEKTDPTGTLKSTREYIETVSLSNSMDNLRKNVNSDNPWDYEGQINGMNQWFTNRRNWINGQISKVDISSTSITVPNAVCNGSEVEPEISITYKGVTLEEGVDYKVEFSNNVAVTTGALAKITGLGLYTGTVNKTFSITRGTLAGGTAKIANNAYPNTELSVEVKNANGDTIEQFVNYQWNADGAAIDGATDSTYTIDEQYRGSTITVTVRGDNNNLAATAITSNECLVSNNDKPTGYTKTIASWNYDFTARPEELFTADETGETYYYTATSGENAEVSNLTASVNAVDKNKIKWSGTADLYENEITEITPDQTPVMGTSKTDLLAWGEFPYFETVTSTLGYENITFSAKLGGTKKGPRDWKLQYSFNGVDYTDVDGATYSITTNKVMEQAFDNVQLPFECENQETLYIRIVVTLDAAINNVNAIVGVTSGDASINNISINGSSTEVITKLTAPVISTTSIQGDSTKIFDTDSVTIADTNGGADVYYTINDGEPTLYTTNFNPFDAKTSKEDNSVVVKAWANFGDINSDVTEYTVSFAGVNLVQFVFDDYSKNVLNGAVFSNGGVYDESGKMTAVADSKSQYVPRWNASNGAFSLAPDDGALWTSTSGFYFEAPVAGYDSINFTAQAYTTAQGPNSVTLQYSTNAKDWVDVETDTKLAANAKLEQLYMGADIAIDTEDVSKMYFRVITTENLTSGNETSPQTKLHNNNSKGNLYINNIVISGTDNGSVKMPYTNKTSDYFGTSPIKYYSPDGAAMQYVVKNAEGKVILSGAYPEAGISITQAPEFDPFASGDYTVTVFAGDDDDRSLANVRHYHYKGDTVTKFNYSATKKPIENYLDETGTIASNTSGANSGTLSMYPDAQNATALSYTGTYGVKVSKPLEAPFAATKNLDKPANNGYWLIKTSTVGYTDLTLTLEQLSSNKGPRDWGLSYSLDGTKFTYISNSNVRAISNDSSIAPVETYNNFALPKELNNQENVWIKLFINGGEGVNGKELELLDSGNTGVNNIELSGVALPKTKEVTVTVVALEDTNGTVGTTPVDADVVVNGVDSVTNNGQIVVEVTQGKNYTVSASVNGTFVNTVQISYDDNAVSIPVVALDFNGDGIINAKDYAIILKLKNNYYKGIFQNFVNLKETDFSY